MAYQPRADNVIRATSTNDLPRQRCGSGTLSRPDHGLPGARRAEQSSAHSREPRLHPLDRSSHSPGPRHPNHERPAAPADVRAASGTVGLCLGRSERKRAARGCCGGLRQTRVTATFGRWSCRSGLLSGFRSRSGVCDEFGSGGVVVAVLLRLGRQRLVAGGELSETTSRSKPATSRPAWPPSFRRRSRRQVTAALQRPPGETGKRPRGVRSSSSSRWSKKAQLSRAN
jgi:hypothetical protein